MPRILVVDDDALARAVIADTIRNLGYQVTAAAGGAQAAALCEETPFDLVITDVRMPQVDGFELARRLGERFPALPVVLISAVRDAELVAESARRGIPVAGFLGKPLGAEPLGRVLERWCSAPLPILDRPGDDWSGEDFLQRVRGPVEAVPPFRLLYVAHRLSATGTLCIEGGGLSARLIVRAGRVQHALGFPDLLGEPDPPRRDHRDLALDLAVAVRAGAAVEGLLGLAAVRLGEALARLVGERGGEVWWDALSPMRAGAVPLPSSIPALLMAGARRVRSDRLVDALWGRREYARVSSRIPEDSAEARWGLDAASVRVLRLAAQPGAFGLLVRKAVGADPSRLPEVLRAVDLLFLLGFLELDTSAVASTRASTAAVAATDPAQVEALRAALREMEGKRPSEILGLLGRVKLTPEVVATAARDASRQYHPDLWFSAAPEVRTLAEACYARLNEAQQALGDPAFVQEEERFLDARAKGIPFVSERDRSQARVAMRKGEILFRSRQWAAADPLLAEAARLDASVWPHRLLSIQCGWLSRRLTADEALAALGELKPTRPEQAAEVDVAVATILKVAGRAADAMARYRAALAKHPENRDAQREVRLSAMREPAAAPTASSLFAGILNRKKPEGTDPSKS